MGYLIIHLVSVLCEFDNSFCQLLLHTNIPCVPIIVFPGYAMPHPRDALAVMFLFHSQQRVPGQKIHRPVGIV